MLFQKPYRNIDLPATQKFELGSKLGILNMAEVLTEISLRQKENGQQDKQGESKLADTRSCVTCCHSLSSTQQVYPTTTSTIFEL